MLDERWPHKYKIIGFYKTYYIHEDYIEQVVDDFLSDDTIFYSVEIQHGVGGGPEPIWIYDKVARLDYDSKDAFWADFEQLRMTEGLVC